MTEEWKPGEELQSRRPSKQHSQPEQSKGCPCARQKAPDMYSQDQLPPRRKSLDKHIRSWLSPKKQYEISYPASPPAEKETNGQRVVSLAQAVSSPDTPKSSLTCFCLLVSPTFFLKINRCSCSPLGLSWKLHWSLSALWTQRAPGTLSCAPPTVLSHHCCHQHITTIVIKKPPPEAPHRQFFMKTYTWPTGT